jgi:hypothetical protein
MRAQVDGSGTTLPDTDKPIVPGVAAEPNPNPPLVVLPLAYILKITLETSVKFVASVPVIV